MGHFYGTRNRVWAQTKRTRNGTNEHRSCTLPHTLAIFAVLAGLMLLPPAAGESARAMPAESASAASGTPEGRISYPAPSPSDPDIIAYTRMDGNRRHLHLYHVTSGEDRRVVHQTRREQTVQGHLRSITRAQSEQIMREAGLGSGYFEGDFVWRPALDQFGYQWFAFVASHAGKTQLHLGFVSSGETLRTVVFPIAYGSVVTNPVFSPDGSALAFSADGQIYIDKDIGTTIRKRDFSKMQPRRITSHANGSFFPAWSADGQLIAYQSRPEEGSRAGHQSIYVIDTASLQDGRLPVAHRVSVDDEEGVMRHHQRPSWAPSGRFLAWYEYAEPSGEEGGSGNTIRAGTEITDSRETSRPAKAIRLIRVEFDQNRSAWTGMLLQRPARRFFAEPVHAYPRSAPRWATIEYDRRPAEGIIWVQNDPDLGHPLHFSHLDYYRDNRADFRFNMFSFSNRFQWLERTSNNSHPVAIKSDSHIRYIYVTATEDHEKLNVVDRRSEGARPLIRRELKEHPAVIRSGLYPGLGHIHIGERRRGGYMAATFTALAGATITSSVLRMTNEGSNPGDALLISLGAASAAVWTYSLLDLNRRFPAYREVPVAGTFEGYRTDVIHDGTHGYGRINGPVKRDAILLSALYPGLGQIYIGERNKGYILGLTFTAFAGSTLAGAAYRYHYPGPTPSNEVLIGLGVATLGTWIYSLIDVQQSFSGTFFAGGNSGTGTGASDMTSPARTQIALTPRLDYLQIGNQVYKEYAAIGLSFSF